MTTADARLSRRHTRSERSDFWHGALRGWDLAFYLMVGIGAVTLVAIRPDGRSVAVALGLLVLLVLAYTVVGRRAARTGSRAGALAYLAVLIAVTTAITGVNPGGSVLLFLAYSQIWFFTETRRAGIVACTVLTVGVFGAIVVYEGFEPAALPGALAQGAVALAFAVLLGLWVTQIAEQSEQRADLVDQLEAAQAEIGRSHHAAGVAAERERMAQEIHDTLAQGFTSIVMLAQTAEADLRRGHPDAAAERIALVERTARDNLAEARALVAAFAPVALDGAGLGEALGRLARRFTEETGVRVDVVLPDGGVPLVREHEVILLRAAQEALANVRRHAGAHRVEVALSVGSGTDGARLEVVDDGRGIDPAAAEGFGLRGMRERVTSGGGALTVTSGPAGGTRVQVSLPVVPATEEPR
ncbi:MAG TPA: sensor histidine kinase [Actinotalea sp.]|nr:sensor histidine kinase [Actinotalea sp.]